MKLTNVKDEQAVTRTLTYAHVLERNLSLSHLSIRESMGFMDAENTITLKRWSERGAHGGNFTFKIQFYHLVKSGWTLWSAKCRLDSDYYHIGIEDVSFIKTKFYMPKNLIEFGVDCEFGFLAFQEAVDSMRAIDLLKLQVDITGEFSRQLRFAQEMVGYHTVKIAELSKELNDLKQSVARARKSTRS